MSSDQFMNNPEDQLDLSDLKNEIKMVKNPIEPAIELTPGLEEMLLNEISLGVSFDGAAKFCGILPTTLHKWMQLGIEQGPGSKYYDFVVKINQLRGRTERALMAKLLSITLDKDNHDWKPIPKVLSMIFPEQYGKGSKVENRIETTINNDNRSVIVTNDQLRNASPEYRNLVVRKTREQLGLPPSVYDNVAETEQVNVGYWLETEKKEKEMADELYLDDL